WMIIVNQGGPTTVDAAIAESSAGPLTLTAVDRAQQEDALLGVWNGSGAGRVAFSSSAPIDISRQANGDMSLVFDVRVDEAPTGPVILSLGGARMAGVDVAPLLRERAGQGWTTVPVRLSCFGTGGADLAAVSRPFELSTSGRMRMGLSHVRL